VGPPREVGPDPGTSIACSGWAHPESGVWVGGGPSPCGGPAQYNFKLCDIFATHTNKVSDM